MKKNNIPIEFVYQLFALIIAIIIVHGYYVSVVRPNANQIIIKNARDKIIDEIKKLNTGNKNLQC